MRKLTYLYSLISLFAYCNVSGAAELQFESGPKQTTLIELYTSQGCSSCPPAEKYLNTFKSNGNLWKQYVPMALHVDYWDYIGWKDEFAHPSHTRRQQNYARFHRMSTIYTPGFFVNGKEWRRGWFGRSLPSASNNAGVLNVHIKNNEIHARYQRDGEKAQLQFNIALLGMGLATDIKAGEREGRHTEHEFVVLAKQHGPSIVGKNHVYQWQTSLPQNNKVKAEKYAIVVWVNKAGSPVPLQAAGSYLP